jgi:cytochrome P450
MMRLTLRIVGETLLSTNVTHEADRVGQALTVALRVANRAIGRVIEIPLWVPTPTNVRLRRALAALNSVVYEVIHHRRQSREDMGDLLSMLMHARDEETGEAMNNRQLRDEVMTIFLAGHETTAVALGWTWDLLSRHPVVAQRLRRELADVLGGRPPSYDDLPRLAYTEQVIKESMRLYPPAWIISRCAIDADRIGGYKIPPRTIIFASPYITHRLPRLWTDPERFDPSRFERDRAVALAPFAYFPFGGGPRLCIGNTFAMIEMILVVATIAQRYWLDVVPGGQRGFSPGITLRPSLPISARLQVVPNRHAIV